MLKNQSRSITENIPLFPLGIIVLPGETRFLHIFETRYKNLFNDLEKWKLLLAYPSYQEETSMMWVLVKLEKFSLNIQMVSLISQ
jgi:hypothetical protein